jgi:hypothetical protein
MYDYLYKNGLGKRNMLSKSRNKLFRDCYPFIIIIIIFCIFKCLLILRAMVCLSLRYAMSAITQREPAARARGSRSEVDDDYPWL